MKIMLKSVAFNLCQTKTFISIYCKLNIDMLSLDLSFITRDHWSLLGHQKW